MGGMIPFGDASRQPRRAPVVTTAIIAVNALVFVLELTGGDAFVQKWSVIPADIVAGQHWITILSAMFMHGGWMHIIGNMVFLHAFGPEVEDAMGRVSYLAFYVISRSRGFARANRRYAPFHRSQSRRKRRDCRSDGRIFDYVSSRSDQDSCLFLVVLSSHFHSLSCPDRPLVSHSALQSDRLRRECAVGWRCLHGSCWRLHLWGGYRANL